MERTMVSKRVYKTVCVDPLLVLLFLVWWKLQRWIEIERARELKCCLNLLHQSSNFTESKPIHSSSAQCVAISIALWSVFIYLYHSFTYHQLSETSTPPTYCFFFKYRIFAMMFIRTLIKTTILPIFLTMIALMRLLREVIYNVYLIGCK
jgi:predicted membrane channel-forming protein YqfA (hemolysin III family)